MTKPVGLFSRAFPMRPFQEIVWQSAPLKYFFSRDPFRRVNSVHQTFFACGLAARSSFVDFFPGISGVLPAFRRWLGYHTDGLLNSLQVFQGFGLIMFVLNKGRSSCDPHAPLLNDRSTRSQQLRIRPNSFRLVYPEVICRAQRRVLSTRTRDASTRDKSRNPNRLFAAIRR